MIRAIVYFALVFGVVLLIFFGAMPWLLGGKKQ